MGHGENASTPVKQTKISFHPAVQQWDRDKGMIFKKYIIVISK